MRWMASIVVAAPLLALVSMASAQQEGSSRAPAKMRLVYVRGPGAERCPYEPEVQAFLTGRDLGEMLDPEAPARLVLTAKRDDKEYAGTAEIIDARGVVSWNMQPIRGEPCSVVMDA